MNNETGVIGEQGESVTYNLELSDGDGIAHVYEPFTEQQGKSILVEASVDDE